MSFPQSSRGAAACLWGRERHGTGVSAALRRPSWLEYEAFRHTRKWLDDELLLWTASSTARLGARGVAGRRHGPLLPRRPGSARRSLVLLGDSRQVRPEPGRWMATLGLRNAGWPPQEWQAALLVPEGFGSPRAEANSAGTDTQTHVARCHPGTTVLIV